MAELFEAQMSVQAAILDASIGTAEESFTVTMTATDGIASSVESTTEQTIETEFASNDAVFMAEFETTGSSGGDYTLPPATATTLGGVIVGSNLSVTNRGVLNVVTADDVEQDNTKPITSAAVYTTVGNINALLELI